MARRILAAEMNSNLADSVAAYGNCPFKMDDEIEIDWKFRIGRDEDSGELYSETPPYTVKFRGMRIGELTDPDDIQWVRKATDEDPHAGAVGRINEIIYGDNPRHIVGFKVEALTGIDAKQLKSRNDYEASKQALMKYWWVVPVLLLLIWWKS